MNRAVSGFIIAVTMAMFSCNGLSVGEQSRSVDLVLHPDLESSIVSYHQEIYVTGSGTPWFGIEIEFSNSDAAQSVDELLCLMVLDSGRRQIMSSDNGRHRQQVTASSAEVLSFVSEVWEGDDVPDLDTGSNSVVGFFFNIGYYDYNHLERVYCGI